MAMYSSILHFENTLRMKLGSAIKNSAIKVKCNIFSSSLEDYIFLYCVGHEKQQRIDDGFDQNDFRTAAKEVRPFGQKIGQRQNRYAEGDIGAKTLEFEQMFRTFFEHTAFIDGIIEDQ